jgi:CotS family spore coat protein
VIGVDIMLSQLESKCSSDINQKEMRTLVDVLNHYDFRVESIDRVRSAYKIGTDKGFFCLKRVSNGYEKAKKSYNIMLHLKENGCDYIAEYYCTKEGKPIIKRKDTAFYLTYWIEGCEASFSMPDEMERYSELLADFHNRAKGFKTPKHVKVKSHIKKWRRTFAKCRDELTGYREYIDRLKLKAEFDYIYKSNIDYFIREAELAIRILDHSRYNELCEYYINEGSICHDSFYYQNIIVDKNNKLFVVDLESCQYDIPMSDLGKMIRRILSKKRFKWDFDLCRRLIESYCKLRPMSKEEYEMLLAILVFPHKFWKLGRKRYIGNKKWNEKKYMKKLKRQLRNREYKREFIYCYINFYGLDLEYDPDIIEL